MSISLLLQYFYNVPTIDIEKISPLLNCLGFTVDRHKGVRSPVICLHFAYSPTAILRGVVSVVINSVYGMFRRRTWPHVGQKSREVVKPFVAHCDATLSVISTTRVSRVIASSFNIEPSKILRTVGAAVGARSFRRFFTSITSTRCDVTSSEIICGSNRLIATRAVTKPCNISTDIFRSLSYNESPKNTTNFIFKSCHHVPSFMNVAGTVYNNGIEKDK